MLKRLCQCIGLASLILVVNYGDLLGGGADVRMHVPFGLAKICLAQIADVVLLGAAIFAVLELLRRTRFYPWVRLLLAIFAPPYLILRTRSQIPFEVTDGLILGLGIAWAALLIFLLLRFPPWYRRAMRTGDALGVFFAIFGFLSIAQLIVVMAWRPGPQQIQAAWQVDPQPPRAHPRLVWVLFDELSYDQLFEHRAPGLQLPNFDALRTESTLYTQMQPIGLKTVKIVPSLFSGGVIDDLRYSFHNKLRVHYTGVRGWHPLDGGGTVFHDAQQAGWRTAVVGWYNPYCTLYGNALDSCYWNNLDRMDGDVAQDDSVASNTWRPLKELAVQLYSPAAAQRESCDFDVRQRLKTHLDLEQHWTALLKDDQADFIFLHIPIPHSPNIWNRRRGAYAQECGGSYLDSLALADRELGLILAELKQSPRWKDTTLIVQGDHSWRIMLWDNQPAWTPEDQRASRGIFDPRPALFIHHPGQQTPQTDSRAMPLLYVHSSIERVLHGRDAQP